jgi:hypothetical protein
MNDWMRRLKGVNNAAIRRAEATTASVDRWLVRKTKSTAVQAGEARRKALRRHYTTPWARSSLSRASLVLTSSAASWYPRRRSEEASFGQPFKASSTVG